MYQKARRTATVEDLEVMFPGMIALTNASEQPILQPKRSDMEKPHYSAKAKTHTVKVQYTTSFDGLIVHKTSHSPGRRHDYMVYKMKQPTFPGGLPYKNSGGVGRIARDHLRHHTDTAYIAMGNAVPGLDYVTPIRRRPGKDKTPAERAYNRAHSRVRIRVENAIRRVKIFRIMKERYRNRLKKYDVINDIVCGLVNQAVLLKRDELL